MRRTLQALVAVALLAACGRVRIHTNDPGARIYADGVLLGRGEADRPRRMGPPSSMEITVAGERGTVHRTVRREFTVVTAVFGLCTYLTSFIWGWQYPAEVYVALPTRAEGGWDGEPSAWDEPPPGWGVELPAAEPSVPVTPPAPAQGSPPSSSGGPTR